MNILSIIKKYKDLIYIIGIVISFLVGTIFGDGIIWKEKELELKQFEVDQAKNDEIISLLEKKEGIFKKITQLNNEFYKRVKSGNLHNEEKINFINHFEILFNNFNSVEKRLAFLQSREIIHMIVPTPIKDNIPPSMLKVELVDSVMLIQKFQ